MHDTEERFAIKFFDKYTLEDITRHFDYIREEFDCDPSDTDAQAALAFLDDVYAMAAEAIG